MRWLERSLVYVMVAAASVALALPSSAWAAKNGDPCPGNSCEAPGQVVKLNKGNSDIQGNVKTKQHIYYEGDALQVSVKFSRGLELLANETVAAHLVVISQDTSIFSVPVETTIGEVERMFFDLVVTTETLPVGQYQVALVVTLPDGDPLNLQDWYNGFRGLLDVEGIYISDEPLPEDADADGECDFDQDGDGFCDDQNMTDDDDDIDDDIDDEVTAAVVD